MHAERQKNPKPYKTLFGLRVSGSGVEFAPLCAIRPYGSGHATHYERCFWYSDGWLHRDCLTSLLESWAWDLSGEDRTLKP